MNRRLLFYSLLFAGSLTGFSQEADTSKITNGTSPLDTLSNNIPVFIIDTEDGAENDAQSQDISGLLQASRDVYLSQVGFNFSFASPSFNF